MDQQKNNYKSETVEAGAQGNYFFHVIKLAADLQKHPILNNLRWNLGH